MSGASYEILSAIGLLLAVAYAVRIVIRLVKGIA